MWNKEVIAEVQNKIISRILDALKEEKASEKTT